jgi:hypothetical protein
LTVAAMKNFLQAFVVCFLALAPLSAQTEWQTIRLDEVEFTIRLIRDVKQIEAILGDPLDEEFILVEVKLRPFYNTRLELDRNDFLLRTRADNDSSAAQSPSRIAGSAVLALGEGSAVGGGVMAQESGPVFGGGLPGGGGPFGRSQPGGVGNAGVALSENTVSAKEASVNESLMERLTRLELPLEKTSRDIAGYLYFQIDPKSKLKHLNFYYDGVHGKLQTQWKD